MDINNKISHRKYRNLLKLSNTLLKENWVQGKIRKKTQNFVELNENESTICQNHSGTV